MYLDFLIYTSVGRHLSFKNQFQEIQLMEEFKFDSSDILN